MNIANALLKKWLVRRRNACLRKSKHYYKLYQEQCKLPSTTYYDNNGKEFVVTNYTKNVPWFLRPDASPSVSLKTEYYNWYSYYNSKFKEYQNKLDKLCD